MKPNAKSITNNSAFIYSDVKIKQTQLQKLFRTLLFENKQVEKSEPKLCKSE